MKSTLTVVHQSQHSQRTNTMLLKPEQRDSPNMIGMAAGVAAINHDYRQDLFHNWLKNYSASSTKGLHRGKGLRRLIKKKVTVQDWTRYVDRRCLSYHVRGCCNTICRQSYDHQVISDEEARLLLDFCQAVERTPDLDDPIIKETSPAPESVSVLNINALEYHYSPSPKIPANDDPIRKEATSVSGLNTNHCNGPLFPTLPSSSDAVGAEGSHPRDSVITSICTTILPSVPKLSRTEHYKQINQDSHQPWSKNSHLLPW